MSLLLMAMATTIPFLTRSTPHRTRMASLRPRRTAAVSRAKAHVVSAMALMTASPWCNASLATSGYICLVLDSNPTTCHQSTCVSSALGKPLLLEVESEAQSHSTRHSRTNQCSADRNSIHSPKEYSVPSKVTLSHHNFPHSTRVDLLAYYQPSHIKAQPLSIFTCIAASTEFV